MKLVYCDTGGYRRELRDLEAGGYISLTTYAYENSTKKLRGRAPGSNPTWAEGDSTWGDDTGAWAEYQESECWQDILALLGAQNVRDAKHLDSAFKAGCQAFLTSDLDDIGRKAPEIYQLLGIRGFHSVRDWDAFVEYLKGSCA